MERYIVHSSRSFEHDLQFYEELPEGMMDYEDLKKLLMDRLTILRAVEGITETTNYTSATKCRRVLTKRLRSAGYESFADLCEGTGYRRVNTQQHYTARRQDHVSHFILLLAMCQSRASRDWIRRMEEFLFEWRLSALDDKGIETFVAINDLKYPIVNEDDKRRMKDQLKSVMKHPSSFDSTAFYRVPAVEMLRSEMRRIYFKEGVAYTELSQLRPAILYQYKSRLLSQIQRFTGAHNYMIDPRIRIVVEAVQGQFENLKPTVLNPAGGRIDKLDEIAKTSYPPCMRNLHEGLRKTHHLRNQGRVQYTVFLKAIGITAEDAVKLYKSEFTKEIDEFKFEKEYPYIFRYIYGLVGAKKAYEVPRCSKIALEKPGPNEFHGCPLASDDIEDLDKLLTNWNIHPSAKHEIVGRVKTQDRGKACAGYFAAVHGRPAINPIVNPKDFYRQSTELCESGDSGQPDAVSIEPDDESDGCECSEQSASSEEHDESDDDCQIVDENYVSMEHERTAKMRRELMEFYESVGGSKELGKNKSGTGVVHVDERSYLDYIVEHFEGLGDKMDTS